LSYEIIISLIKEVPRLFLTKNFTIAFTKINPLIPLDALLERVKTVHIEMYQ
jgi:hypothetical protein